MVWHGHIISYHIFSYRIDYDLSSSFLLDIWQCRDEHNNFQQKFDAELVKEAKRFGFSVQSKVRVKSRTTFLFFSLYFFSRIEVEAEVRKNVDELMREELKNLKMVGWLCCQIQFHFIVNP